MPNYHKYSDSQKQFLAKNISQHTYAELTELFNCRFGTSLKTHSISDICTKRLKIKRNKNTGNFSVRADRPNAIDVGNEVWRSGYIFIKVNNKYHFGKTQYSQMAENWQPKHRHIYEQVHGKIPKGNIVVFLDGDITNFDIDNLYCISRDINVRMNQNKWFSNDRNTTLAAIKWCELNRVLRKEGKNAD